MLFHRIRYFFIFSVFSTIAALVQMSLAQADTVNNASASTGDETIVWERAPIAVTLPIGKERFISFPSAVQFGYDKTHLSDAALRVENDHETLYLTAEKPFATERVEAKLATGDIVLMDISTVASGDDNPIDVVLPKNTSADTAISNSQGSQDLDYVSLTRYAIQQLYAPTRLLTDSSAITRFPMETTHVVPLFYDDSISAMPLASWRDSDSYITAVLIKNRLNQPLRLDPRLLCGDWKAATFFPHSTLAQKGLSLNQDTSTLFVVSDRPFHEAMSLCVVNS